MKTTPTDREQQVLDLVVKGLTDVEMAIALRLSPSTIAGLVRNLMMKLQTRNRAHLAAIAIKEKLVT